MSTREDLLQKYMSSFGFALNDQEIELVRGAYNDGWQAAMESQWISVDDRLPDDQQHCWCVFKSHAKMHCRYLAGEFCWYDFEADRFYIIENATSERCGITHWMPLPQPPKENL
jgi:hypothetical protein